MPVPALRRQFLAALFLCAGFVTASALRADETIKIMAANLSSGTGQNYDGGEGNRIFRGLKPDIVMVQEMNIASNSDAAVRTWVNDNFGSSFNVFREPGNKSIPNGVVSRYPILQSGVWADSVVADRSFVWAKIDIPGDKNLWAVSVHLKASSGSTNVTKRNTQATALKGYIQANVPAGDYIAIAGDFNTYSRTESCVTTFSSFMSTAGPYPADADGDPDTNSGRSSPYDWVLPDPGLAARATPLKIGSKTFTNGLVFDSRVYTPLSEVSPVQLADSGATGMQHMGVVRAFLIPVAAANQAPKINKPTSGKASVSMSRGSYPTPFSLSLTGSDANGDTLTWSVLTPASHGTAGVVAPVTGNTVAISYQPVAGFTGTDSFFIQAADGKGGSDSIEVEVSVQPVDSYTAWAQDEFAPLSATDEATRWGENADPDHDGYTNLQEFASGMNPKSTDGGNPLTCTMEPPMTDPDHPETAVPPHVLLSYRVRLENLQPALDYVVQKTTSLASASWTALAESDYTLMGDAPVDEDFIDRTIRLNAPAEEAVEGEAAGEFFRLQVSR